ncbi:Type II/IV secretion system secretin RcpA/CpaC, associated with Flp pilus assembly [Vibrio chagasii]|uniref:type II and III secretion system protein family protein n=1 Tax=Vibrio splendidus TaxID=29497 RepID=UPI00076AC416|nr:type II and III secretion system protein family protein [Vibrio splendidus]CAH6782087.1 Type II/IV secretion system secretin RcpA/CpaC, associated with Flp pilus assembly [Vibrio chagasii]CAH6832307.1 Type II/IV secretion system secretin RcpA/CpaC, associated with Flp pilus assembly [Vibrio chagasii]CAH6840621.1 Type II/IV secretion system secretin RcpA/CpaC, associated with Flp pilus assembly [Vibrio chagasii]CAH6861911.1 Type II/IV secretion system secretin RcpA/CpaC, associated with Flp p
MASTCRWWGILLLSSLCLSFASAASALDVTINEAKMIRLPEKAKSIFISSTHIADYQTLTNTKVMVFGKRAGTATITVLNEQERVIYTNKIRVTHNSREFNELVKNKFPEASVNAESLGGKLWLKGQVPSPMMAHNIVSLAKGYLSPIVDQTQQQESSNTQNGAGSSNTTTKDQPMQSNEDELINQLVVTMPNQVNIRVKIAEVSRNVSNKLGIKWGSIAGGVGQFSFSKLPNVSSWGKPSITALIDALATNGMMSVLAEPNLTAMSGEDAEFLVGGQVPLPLITADTTQIEYKDFGVKLNFTPTVLSQNRISLKVNPEVSNVSIENQQVVNGTNFPSFTTRSAATTIELASGQSFALGGLLKSEDIEQLQKVPLIAEIPVLGSLFRSTEFTRRETELIIIVTAYLVQPTRSDSMQLPTDGLIPLSDVERLLAWPRIQRKRTHDQDTYTDNHKPRLLGDNGFYY